MYLGSEEPLVIALMQELNHQLIFNKWKYRQTYALICSQLISTGSINILIFVNEMLPHLYSLSEDKVPNVRLVVARTLANDIMPMGSKCNFISYVTFRNLFLKYVYLYMFYCKFLTFKYF